MPKPVNRWRNRLVYGGGADRGRGVGLVEREPAGCSAPVERRLVEGLRSGKCGAVSGSRERATAQEHGRRVDGDRDQHRGHQGVDADEQQQLT